MQQWIRQPSYDVHPLMKAETEIISGSTPHVPRSLPRCCSEIVAPSETFMDLMMLQPDALTLPLALSGNSSSCGSASTRLPTGSRTAEEQRSAPPPSYKRPSELVRTACSKEACPFPNTTAPVMSCRFSNGAFTDWPVMSQRLSMPQQASMTRYYGAACAPAALHSRVVSVQVFPRRVLSPRPKEPGTPSTDAETVSEAETSEWSVEEIDVPRSGLLCCCPAAV